MKEDSRVEELKEDRKRIGGSSLLAMSTRKMGSVKGKTALTPMTQTPGGSMFPKVKAKGSNRKKCSKGK